MSMQFATDRVAVFGLGYVGVVTLACLSQQGRRAIGVDIDRGKVERLNTGQAPIEEREVPELLQAGVADGRISATVHAAEAVAAADVSFVSVGTPTGIDGRPNFDHVYRVCEQIGEAVARKGEPHLVVLRSTVLPGETARCGELLRAKAGGVPVAIAFNPEFLREGSAVKDFREPPYTIIGTDEPAAEVALRELYSDVAGEFMCMAVAEAELVKCAGNAWHACKIAFANEIGRLARHFGIDGRSVMGAIAADRKLGASPAYMRPGFAYGGSCLPKDLRALTATGRVNAIDLPLLESLAVSNQAQIDLAVGEILATGERDVGLLGLAFKAGTDDLRESPAVMLAERLLGKGCRLRILDPVVRQAKLVGSNRAYIDRHLPHLAELLVEDPRSIVDDCGVVAVTHNDASFAAVIAALPAERPLFDYCGYFPTPPDRAGYRGIAWNTEGHACRAQAAHAGS